ncbi:MAG TPA: lipopolysaccharide biosynthesis protein RfbH [Elusimicrobia bacterium]|nr:lipopolysaccharide biosynthesis protein RfbH [Elusimicrobiota bacterium]HBT62861.1 lipopolysaccharide biosynthesis protein RfbH [Elusimicrobiota bacterium]
MKALVIGVSGQLGASLFAVLSSRQVQVVGTHCAHPMPDSVFLDARDGGAVRRLVAEVSPEVIFLAQNTPGGVDFCEAHPDEASALIVQAARNVLAAAAPLRARIVYFSSDYVFDGKSGPYDEAALPCPLSAYGQAKLAGERLLQDHPHLIIRTTAVFSWAPGTKNLAMQVWENLRAGKTLRVPNDQWCNPTLAEYLAEASVALAEAGQSGIFNVVGRDWMPRSELAAALARALGLDPALILPAPTGDLNQRALRPLKGGLKTDKLRAALGSAPLSLPQALERLVRRFRESSCDLARAQVPASVQQAKADILDKVRRYHALAHPSESFIPRQSRVRYAGRVFGESEMVNLVDSALDFWLTLGPYGDKFEDKLRRFFGSRDFVYVNSGSTANLSAVMALMSRQIDGALKPGDEIITPAVTFPTTVTPLVHAGLVPVFVDCELGTYNVDPKLVAQAVSPKTRGLMIPHTLGNPCDMDAIMDIVRRHRLFLIEDACDALGSAWRGQLVGTFGELGTLSFFPAHHMTTGEGGGVIVNDARLSRIVRSVRDWGRDCWCAPGKSDTCGKRFAWKLGGLPFGYDHKYIYSNLGYNFKPTDLQAAIGVAQADRLPDFIARRRRNFKRLYEGLQPFQDRLILPRLDARADPSWFALPLTVDGGVSRNELVAWLESAGIETRQVFAGNILQQPAYAGLPMRRHGSLEITDRIMKDTFFVGVYPGMTDAMLDYILETFAAFFAAARSRAPHA